MEITVFVLSLLAAVLAVGLLRERRLRLALAVLLKRLLERWRNGHASAMDDDMVRTRDDGTSGL
jgi:putative copper export protein